MHCSFLFMSRRLAILALLVVTCFGGSSQAANIIYANNPGAQDFTAGANWTGGIAPGPTDIAFINGVDGVVDYALINSPVTVQRFLIGEDAGESGGLELRSNAVFATNTTGVHYMGTRGVGHLRIADGASMTLLGSLQIGWGDNAGHGNGTVTQDGGSYTGTSATLGNSAAVLGDPNRAGSVGLYILNDGIVNLTGAMTVGSAGTGAFDMNAGAITLGGQLVVGNSGTGTFDMKGGSVTTATFLQIGRTGTGTFTQSDGALTVNRVSADPAVVIASNAGGTGTYEISNGSLTVAATNGGVSVGSATSNGTFRVIGDAATVIIGSTYRQASPSKLELEIGNGITSIVVGGDAFLDGTLDVGFSATPSLGDQFTIMTYRGNLTGTFSTFDFLVDSPAGPDSVLLSIDYGTSSNDAIVLTVIPEPASISLASFAMAISLIRVLRHKPKVD